MKKILCLVIAIMLMLTCVGCSSTVENVGDNEKPSMFVQVEMIRCANGGANFIFYHKNTKVMYYISYDGVATVMLDADGKPLLWEG